LQPGVLSWILARSNIIFKIKVSLYKRLILKRGREVKKIQRFLVFLLVLIYSNHLCLAQQILKKHDYYPKEENDIYFRVVSDMTIDGDKLIAVINMDHTALIFLIKDGIEFLKKLGSPGQGPGEFNLPIAAATFNKTIAIRDSQGLSIFDDDGEFIKRYSKYFRGKNFIYLGEREYHLNYNPENPHLINVTSLEGELLDVFGTKFVLDPAKLKGANPVNALATVHKGKLIYDGQSIFYLNSIFGKLFKFTPEGKELLESDLIKIVGKSGKTALKKNEDTWLRKGLESPGRYPYWPLFIDAAYSEGEIFLLIDLRAYGTKDSEKWVVKSFNADTLDLSGEYNIDIEEVRRIYSFAVRVEEGNPIFYLSIDTDESYVIAEYK
jgi:hypothetical protein